jgi:cytochrome c-type biogenesis protein CcmH/NrfF
VNLVSLLWAAPMAVMAVMAIVLQVLNWRDRRRLVRQGQRPVDGEHLTPDERAAFIRLAMSYYEEET